MEQTELQRAIEAILFASGERVEISRLAMAKPDNLLPSYFRLNCNAAK